jgi:hypothetical protein
MPPYSYLFSTDFRTVQECAQCPKTAYTYSETQAVKSSGVSPGSRVNDPLPSKHSVPQAALTSSPSPLPFLGEEAGTSQCACQRSRLHLAVNIRGVTGSAPSMSAHCSGVHDPAHSRASSLHDTAPAKTHIKLH